MRKLNKSKFRMEQSMESYNCPCSWCDCTAPSCNWIPEAQAAAGTGRSHGVEVTPFRTG
jgi:putative bacteriocin precursor